MPERPTARQRIEAVRARQRAGGADRMTPEQAFYALMDQLAEHADPHHRWRKVGGCVWCTTCNARLYQGSLFTAKERAELVTYRQWRAAGMPERTEAEADG